MRKSKLMKALLVFGMSVVTATSMVGIAACTDSGNDDDDKGNGCQHEYDGWNTSSTEHWHECVNCSEEADRGNHVDVKNNKTDAAGADNYCDVCGYELAHTFATTWSKDASGHWHDATCHPVNDGVKPHVDDGVAAGSTENDGICDICGYENVTSQGYKDFVANKITANATKFIDNTFFIANELPLFTSWGTAGIYASDNGDHKVDVSGGKAHLIKPNTAPSTCLYLDWGNVAGSVVEGFFKISDVTGSNGYTAVQFTTSDGTNDSELFGLRTNSGNEIKYRLNGGSDVSVPGAPAWNSGATAEGNISVYYKYDVSTNKITVTINDTAFVTDLQLNGTALKGIKFSSGSNTYTSNYAVDDIIVIKTPVDVTAYKNAILANSTAERGKVTAAGFEIGTPMQTADQALTDALSDANATTATLTEAYDTWFANLLVVYGNAVKNKIIYTDYLATDYDDPKNEDAAAYTDAVEKLETDIKAAKTVENITAAYKAADTTIKALGNDAYWTSETFALTVNFGENGSATIPDKRSGDKVTKAELDAVVTGLDESEAITGYTVNGNTVDFGTDGYVVTEATTFVAVIQTVTSDKGTYTYTLGTKTDTEPTITVAPGSLSDGTGIFDASGMSTATDFAGWKFGGSSDSIVLTLNVEAGQIITLNLNGYTGSSGNPVAIDVTATNATTTAASQTIIFASTTSKDNVGSGSLTYTATAAGQVKLTLVRGDGGNGKKTTKLTSVSVTVADPA